MDRRLLHHYDVELSHLRQTAAEFAREFPKVAGRLGLDTEGRDACPDPFVERLLEGFAYLTARVQLKMDAGFPRLSQALLETVYPHYLCPSPSMAVVRFEPAPNEGSLAAGAPVPRGTILRTPLGKGERTACEYRTAHDLTLWPLEVTKAEYLTRELTQFNLPPGLGARAVLRVRLRVGAGASFADLPLDRLPFFLRGGDDLPDALYEQIFAHATAIVVLAPGKSPAPAQVIPAATGLRRVGFEREEALLPQVSRTFSAYRLLQEYFAFRQRFLFFELTGLRAAVGASGAREEAEILIVLRRQEPRLEGRVDAGSLALFCSPAINLFPKRADRIALNDRSAEFQVVMDRTRPFEFEVFDVTGVTGYSARNNQEQTFRPFYLAKEGGGRAFYTVFRAPRQLSAREREFGRHHAYTGTETFVSLVDAQAAPFRPDLQGLGVDTLCTNRHLPQEVAFGQGRTDFNLEIGAPVAAVRCLAGPTAPRPPLVEGANAWQLISHLSLNYLSLLDAPGGEGAAALREILRLYADPQDAHTLKQIDGLRAASTAPVLRRMEGPGPITFARGLEVSVLFDETPFEGTGVFVLGGVLAEFFRRYVSINTFAETVIRTETRREIMRWPGLPGRRPVS